MAKTRFFGKRSLHLALSLLMVSLLPARAVGWERKGHQIIARIAEDRLSSNARQNVAKLLGKETLESASTWADDVSRARKDTERWHFVDIPSDKNDYIPRRDCKLPDGICLIEAIERQIAVLKTPGEDPVRRTEALKFIVHLIGDLHQPFHVSTKFEPFFDRYGYKVQVTFFGRGADLHSVWDDSLISHALGQSNLIVADYAGQLSRRVTKRMMVGNNVYTRGTITDWALEAHRAARAAYPTEGDTKLGGEYYDRNRLVVENQLIKAGVRLATVLNAIFDVKQAY